MKNIGETLPRIDWALSPQLRDLIAGFGLNLCLSSLTTSPMLFQLCFTSTLVKGVVANEHLKTLIRRILPRDEPLQLENTVPALAAIYAIMAFQLTGQIIARHQRSHYTKDVE